MWIWIFNITVMSLFLVPGILAVYFILERQRSRKALAALAPYYPNVTVLLPFRGLDYNFESTLQSLADQKYAGNYEVLAVTSEENGRGEALVHQYAARSPLIQLVKASHSEVSQYRSDKVNNLLTGIAHASKETEIYLFIDSDIVPQATWIEQMVQPLQSDHVGLTSGSAWIVSKSRSVMALAARYWDFLATTMITFPVTRFARGFSFGIRAKVFEQIGMKSIWSEAFHDNFTISDVVRRAGYSIQYVPDCLVPEHFDIHGFAWVKWVKRQALNTKVNYKRLWAFGFFLVTMPRLLGAVLFLVALGFALTGSIPSLLEIFLYWPLLHIAGATIVVAAVSRDASQIQDYRPSVIRTAGLVLSSFVSVLYCISSLWAVISNKMEWRNLVYHQKTPFTTVVTGERGSKHDPGQ
ncbi:glycosyltransferase family 2 protein [Paenibacillus sp. FSL K6-1096]|uniref:glycosyltransferase n=1 Tax=Paenibacillus sp. FSL K6-1096 TaxID=2921460 RepID=UPI0030ECC715